MGKVWVQCDRCGEFVEGARDHGHTTGFYDVRREPWSKYGGWGEAIVCDPCMKSDPDYRRDYPPASAVEAAGGPDTNG